MRSVAPLVVLLLPALAAAQPASTPPPPTDAPPADAPANPPPAAPAAPAAPVPAPAPPAFVPHYGHQRGIGILAELGFHTGAGVGARVGGGNVGARVSAAWYPLIVGIRKPDPAESDFDAASSLQINADVFALPIQGTERSRFGPIGGYRYNSLLGHGASLGADAVVDLGPHLAFEVLGGITWFPSGNARARDQFGIAAEDDFGFPGPELVYALEAALIFYP